VVCIAPATAHTLAKLALGLADDLVTTTCLATRAPLVIAPAMDADMYDHPAVAANVTILRERGARIIEPGHGRMASGLVGQGRLAEPPEIVDTLRIVLARNGDLKGWRVVVTAGGTQEALDPVRYLSNRSSGKMGYSMAEAARDRGASVLLITTPTALIPPFGIDVKHVVSAADMHDAVMAALPEANLLVMAAAVADYRPATFAEQKIKKRDDDLTLQLAKTTDILAATAGRGPRAPAAPEARGLRPHPGRSAGDQAGPRRRLTSALQPVRVAARVRVGTRFPVALKCGRRSAPGARECSSSAPRLPLSS
jgi:phosphopantothenoylcysteine decarboxylase/phosphopantothenate--cysteine ligase